MAFLKTKSGFAIVELVAILVVVGLLSFVGYTAYNKLHNNASVASTTTQKPVATDVKPTPAINSTSDLTNAESTLDQTDTSSSSDLNSLDSQLNAF